MVDEYSLYIHVPFCKKKCGYCHFFVLPFEKNLVAHYLAALKKECLLRAPFLENKKLLSIYFGGGTPSLLPPETLAEILSWLLSCGSDVEITLEANPEGLSLPLLEQFFKIGINRLSIGVQSLDDFLLSELTRQHSVKKAIDTILQAKIAGFNNISIDLMYDVPSQTLPSWRRTLDRAVELPIAHLSLYNLTLEPQTAFYKQRKKIESKQPLEQESLSMLETAIECFEKNGLKRYEISAFAKDNFRSIHNSGYWQGRPFLGLGPSAYSYWDKSRFSNHAHLAKYCKDLEHNLFPIGFSETLEKSAHTKELLAIRLRMLDGVDLKEWELSLETKETIEKLIELKLVSLERDILSLTNKGTLFYDTVATELIDGQ